MNLSEYKNNILQIPGIRDGVFYGQFDRVDEINSRILDRDVPDNPLPPNFDPRPVLSKFAVFPMLDNRMPATVPIKPNFDYSLKTNFTPPLMSFGPPSGYINNVETENQLRNQYFALQRGAGQNVYIPSKDSDLYKVTVPQPSKQYQEEQPYPGLFAQPTFETQQQHRLAATPNIGKEMFHNSTRSQLRAVNGPV